MNKKNPYGMDPKFDPEEILQRPQDRLSPPRMDFDEPREVFTSAAAGRAPHNFEPPLFDGAEPDSDSAPERNAGEGAKPAPENAGYGITYEELAALAKEHLCPNCPTAGEAEDLRLRSLAEMDNARKRMLKEHEESVKFAASNVLSDILPALDNLDLALEHARGRTACRDFFTGVEMTRKIMLDALKNHGLLAIGSEGEEFDPSIHEAVGINQDSKVDDGAVSAVLTRGYKLHGRLLRPARVIVCKK
ncbi:MAG: nucleotide exchange factor GrpE [Deltaproteobacteria bacterium]|nr:nucleotide exchange factor GrpE [Deltaproteobacteria bacterium]